MLPPSSGCWSDWEEEMSPLLRKVSRIVTNRSYAKERGDGSFTYQYLPPKRQNKLIVIPEDYHLVLTCKVFFPFPCFLWANASTLGLPKKILICKSFPAICNHSSVQVTIQTVRHSFIHSFIRSFIHSFWSLSYDRSITSSKKSFSPQSAIQCVLCQFPVFFLFVGSSNKCLCLLPRLPITSVLPSIFPSITCLRAHFLRKMWPIKLAFFLSEKVDTGPSNEIIKYPIWHRLLI
jgi:hypothetical protein